MSTAIAPSPTRLLTAEEYRLLPDWRERQELRRGVVIRMPPPGFRHGEVCWNISHYVGTYVRQQRIGRVLCNDAGIITERDPDTVRGADVSYYSYLRVPKDESPIGYPGASPEIIFKVVSPSNTRLEIAEKIGEYLRCGVHVVCVADPEFRTVNVHYPNRPTELPEGEAVLTLADLPGFAGIFRRSEPVLRIAARHFAYRPRGLKRAVLRSSSTLMKARSA
jgi:Uma2 family endonuclease